MFVVTLNSSRAVKVLEKQHTYIFLFIIISFFPYIHLQWIYKLEKDILLSSQLENMGFLACQYFNIFSMANSSDSHLLGTVLRSPISFGFCKSLKCFCAFREFRIFHYESLNASGMQIMPTLFNSDVDKVYRTFTREVLLIFFGRMFIN